MDRDNSARASTLSSQIREEARRLGFFKVGIASIRSLPHDEHFKKWLQEGRHGAMGYLERDSPKRLNPKLVFPNARSMVVLAMNYHTGYGLAHAPLKGRISRYAWGDDYHAAAKMRLEKLFDFIRQQEPTAEGLVYVDTGPVMEKAWGAQTNLGWTGKNTILITRDCGSWYFIGVLLLDLELAYDSEEKDFCGRCSRCIKACPTGAIVAPYILDARLCISYLTTELRSPIPRPLRPLVGNRIYGCDDCQEVCPWNRFAVRTFERGFNPRDGNLMPDLLPLIRMTPREFKERFRNSPILRATRDGFVRNVAVALGNSGRSEAVPALEDALQDTSPLVRIHAAWALGQIASKQACSSLQSARGKESDPSVLEEISLALQKAP